MTIEIPNAYLTFEPVQKQAAKIIRRAINKKLKEAKYMEKMQLVIDEAKNEVEKEFEERVKASQNVSEHKANESI